MHHINVLADIYKRTNTKKRSSALDTFEIDVGFTTKYSIPTTSRCFYSIQTFAMSLVAHQLKSF